MKKYLVFLSLALPTLLAARPPSPVTLPAGSVNELAAAITAAGPGGTVVVASGVHTETGTVLVTSPVTIAGQPGAIIQTESAPGPAYPIAITPLLHIQNASGVTVQGIWFRPLSGGAANTAIVIENAPHAEIAENRITDFQFGVVIQRADHSVIRNNEIRTTRRWALDPADPQFVIETDGIMLNSGHFVQIVGNTVADSLQGIFGSDENNRMSDNRISESFFGVVLCHNPVEPPFYLLNGQVLSSDAPAARWTIQKNTVTTSAWGYLIIDGAHHNVLVNNHASDNSVYDIELVGDSFRAGFFTPASHDNLVAIGSDKSLVVKDCGIDNHVAGPAILVDLNADPCF